MINKFEFNESKGGFDSHIKNSIPAYDVLVQETTILANHWLNDDSLPVIDIGGSTGKLMDLIQQKSQINTPNKFFSIDPTVFEWVANESIIHVNEEAQKYIQTITQPIQIAFSLFTLQFLTNDIRYQILSEISDRLSSNGAFFVAEKFYMEDSEYQELYSVVLREMKRTSFKDADILDKDYKLLKHLKLRKEIEFIKEMREHGFRCMKYWQSLHFNAYICTK